GSTTLGSLASRPVNGLGGLRSGPAELEGKDRTGKDLPDAAVDGVWSGDVAVSQKQRQRASVNLPGPRGMLAKGLQLRAKKERVAHPSVIQGLLAQAIAHEVQAMLQLVNDRKGEHAGEPPHRVHDAPPLHGLQHHFRIGVTPKTRSVRFELRPQVLEIVDLPVENDDVTTIVGPQDRKSTRLNSSH